jgi:hypothetical protein
MGSFRPFASDPGTDPLPHATHHFVVDKVELALLNLDPNKGAGPDGIPPLILKNCATAFALPLCLIFNTSMSTCVFPDRWKISHVTPIFKAGSRNDDTNYRGIAILSAAAKLFEFLIFGEMYVNLKSLISENQHGFVKGRRTVSNLLEYTSFVLKSMESGQVDLVYTDFSKAAVPPRRCE